MQKPGVFLLDSDASTGVLTPKNQAEIDADISARFLRACAKHRKRGRHGARIPIAHVVICRETRDEAFKFPRIAKILDVQPR